MVWGRNGGQQVAASAMNVTDRLPPRTFFSIHPHGALRLSFRYRTKPVDTLLCGLPAGPLTSLAAQTEIGYTGSGGRNRLTPLSGTCQHSYVCIARTYKKQGATIALIGVSFTSGTIHGSEWPASRRLLVRKNERQSIANHPCEMVGIQVTFREGRGTQRIRQL